MFKKKDPTQPFKLMFAEELLGLSSRSLLQGPLWSVIARTSFMHMMQSCPLSIFLLTPWFVCWFVFGML